jgi:hypothetical protein
MTRLPTPILLSLVLAIGGYGATVAAAAETAETILPSDPRFDVFELSNSTGDGMHASSTGTILLSFASKDSRYCRAARFPADKEVVLACREEGGWKIEAISSLAPVEATHPTNFGGSSNIQEVGDAVEALRAGPDLLGHLEVIVAASRGWRNPYPFDETTLDARQILKRTYQVYRASKSYVDTGIVQTRYKNLKSEWTGETRFKTAYVAPVDFLFESTMNDFGTIEVGFIAGHNQNGVQAWSSTSPKMMGEIASIQKALDAGAGISRDSSGMIPGLIFPGTKLGGDIVRLTDAVRLENAQIDGTDCYQVQGFRWPNTGQPTTVWIAKDSFLIRRVYEEQTINGDTTKTTWFYNPAINVPVDKEALRFFLPSP